MWTISDLKKIGVKVAGQSGDEAYAHCPYHDDRNPSFYVNLRKGVFYCHGCGSAGRVSALGLEVEDVFSKLLEMLQEERNNGGWLEAIPLPDEYKPIEMSGGDAFYCYLRSRKISDDIIRRARLGCCCSGKYFGRVIIPTNNGFVARSIFKAGKKYLFPKGFRHELYYIEEPSDYVILVEGVFDVLTLQSLGFINVVAVLGSHITDGEMLQLFNFPIRNVVIMFDGDMAGWIGAKEAYNKLSKFFITRVCNVPIGYDPADMEKEDIERIIKNSKKIFHFWDKRCIIY